MSGDWFAVTPVHPSKRGLYASPYSPVVMGSDYIEVVKRRRLALERSLNKRTGLSYRDMRPGHMYAVWWFEKRIPLAEVKKAMRTTHPWRVVVLTSSTGWDGMAELCLPEGLGLFEEEKET